MSSPLLALFIRLLREDARGHATYWARSGLGCFLLVVMALFALPSRGLPAPGRMFFSAVIGFQLLAVTLMGLSYFASAIAEEKEEQTLGLLRMTGLGPLSILLGKSTSRLCGALLLLAAQFPFTVIAVTLGGISLWQVLVSYCTVGAFIFLLCNLALLGSVLSRGTAGAAVFSVLVLGLLLVAIPALKGVQWLATNYSPWHLSLDPVAKGIWTATPIARLQEVLGTGYHGNALGWQAFANIAFGIGCFLLAWMAFQRFCERELEGAGTTTRVVASIAVNKLGVRLRGRSLPRAWAKAIVWKDFYFLWGGRTGFIIRTACYGGALLYDGWQLATTGSASAVYGFGTFSYPLMPFVLSIDVSVMASRVFRTELRDQTFSTLAMLPCSIRDIVHDKVRACLLAAAPGAICSLAIQVLFLVFMRENSAVATPLPMRAIWMVAALTGWLDKILLVVLIAFLSLYMKRGALPAGWLLTIVGSWVLTVIWMLLIATATFAFLRRSASFASFMEYGPSVANAALGLFLSWMFYVGGIQRLQTLAGEE